MKKYLLSISAAVLFVMYLVYQKGNVGATQADLNSTLPPLTTNQSNTQVQGVPAATSSGSTPPDTTTGSSSSGQVTVPPVSTAPAGMYKDGTYTGSRADAYYGYIQVQAVISGGKLADVQFLEYPNDHRESIQINTRALPILRSEAVAAQSAQVDAVSRATDSSAAFVQSLASALAKAKN